MRRGEEGRGRGKEGRREGEEVRGEERGGEGGRERGMGMSRRRHTHIWRLNGTDNTLNFSTSKSTPIVAL